MGFLDFLKNIFKEEREFEKIKFEQIENWVENKKQENSKKEKEFLSEIKKRIFELIENLEEKTIILEEININEKKVEERVKFIVKENLERYVYYVKKLISNLESLNSDDQTKEKGWEFKRLRDPNNLIQNINDIFSDFEKKSRMSFEKATFLIGKELGDVKDAILNFSYDFQRLLKENKDFLENSKILSLIEEKLKEINESEKIKNKAEKNIKEVQEKIDNLKSQINNFNKNIEDIKQSNEYVQEKEQEKQIADKEKLLRIEVSQLKELIDFKKLANICHSNEKDMAVIKAHKDNFQKSFEADTNKIIDLLKETKLDNNEIYKKLEKINGKQNEIEQLKSSLNQEQTQKILQEEGEKRKIELDIENLQIEKFKEERKQIKLEKNIQDIISEIKQELIKMNVELELALVKSY